MKVIYIATSNYYFLFVIIINIIIIIIIILIIIIVIIITIIVTDPTHSKTILENTVEVEPQPVDFKNLSQYSNRSK